MLICYIIFTSGSLRTTKTSHLSISSHLCEEETFRPATYQVGGTQNKVVDQAGMGVALVLQARDLSPFLF